MTTSGSQSHRAGHAIAASFRGHRLLQLYGGGSSRLFTVVTVRLHKKRRPDLTQQGQQGPPANEPTRDTDPDWALTRYVGGFC